MMIVGFLGGCPLKEFAVEGPINQHIYDASPLVLIAWERVYDAPIFLPIDSKRRYYLDATSVTRPCRLLTTQLST